MNQTTPAPREDAGMRERRALKLRQKNRYTSIARSIVDNNNNSFFICQAFF